MARVPRLRILVTEGWNVERCSAFNAVKERYIKTNTVRHRIRIVNGPAFRLDGTVIDEVEHTHICNLLGAPSFVGAYENPAKNLFI